MKSDRLMVLKITTWGPGFEVPLQSLPEYPIFSVF